MARQLLVVETVGATCKSTIRRTEVSKPRHDTVSLCLFFSHVLYAGCVAQKACEDLFTGVEAANRVQHDSS